MRELAPLLIPVRVVGNFARSFHPAELPPQLRRTYSRELVSWAFLPLMLGAIEGGTIGIVIKRRSTGSPESTHGGWTSRPPGRSRRRMWPT